MIRILSIIICFFSVQHDEPILNWSESYKLSWEDFKADPDFNSSAVAITASGLTFSFSVKETNTEVISFSTEVKAHFYPEKSWYKPELANDHILGHEQLHFDITELHARKFRQEISMLKTTSSIKSDLKQLHKKINIELALMQDNYDNETNYSRRHDMQTNWKVYVTEELQKLASYKSVN